MNSSRLHPLNRLLVAVLSASLLAGPAWSQNLPSGLAGMSPDAAASAAAAYGAGADRASVNSGAASMGALGGFSATPSIRQAGNTPAPQANEAALESKPSPLAPLPPNDFQRFVLETSGQLLPLFGASFFSQGAVNQSGSGVGLFAPQPNTPVSPDYRMGPGDELQIKGWGSVDIDVRATIDRNGLITLPKVGAINLAGVQSSQAEGVIKAAVGKYYRDFQLSVTLGQLKGITVYVVGQARKPGAYSLSGASTLVSALFASGGPNQNGSMRRVQVKRGSQIVTEIDLYAFLAKGDKSADVKLLDGDTIVIPSAQAYAALSGKVPTPAVYELKNEADTIGEVLALAGGLPVVANPLRAQLERLNPQAQPARTVEAFALDAVGLTKRLQSGDLLSINAVVPEFANAVSLRGNVSEALRSPWREGMRVSDLILSRATLMSRASVKRQNDTQLNSTDTTNTLAQRIGNLVDEVNFDYAVVERIDNNKVRVQLLPFNLGRALDEPSSPDNLPLKAGDIVTVFSVNDVRVPQAKRQVFVRVEGEVKRPGIYQMQPGDTLPSLLDKAGGLTPDAYLFGAGFYREEVQKAQTANLEQLVRRIEVQSQSQLSKTAASAGGSDGAAASLAQLRIQAEAQAQKQAIDRLRNLKPTGRIALDLPSERVQPSQLPPLRLQAQDRLVVPARPDFVHVLGSVNTETALIWREGKSIAQYLEQSGLTSGADKDELFVLRADGSVLSNNGRTFSSVLGDKALPGDVIVLPEKTDHESGWSLFTRNAKDITQIIYQFSLGAAAIKTLRQ